MLPLACPLLTVHYCNPLWFLKEKLTTTSNWFGYCSKFIGHQCYMAWKMHVLRLRHEAQLKCLTETRLWLCWIRVEKSAQEILSKKKTKTARIQKTQLKNTGRNQEWKGTNLSSSLVAKAWTSVQYQHVFTSMFFLTLVAFLLDYITVYRGSHYLVQPLYLHESNTPFSVFSSQGIPLKKLFCLFIKPSE